MPTVVVWLGLLAVSALTAVYREVNPHTALGRGQALHGLFDAVVGLS